MYESHDHITHDSIISKKRLFMDAKLILCSLCTVFDEVRIITHLRVLYQIYNHQAWAIGQGRGEYESDIARVGML